MGSDLDVIDAAIAHKARARKPWRVEYRTAMWRSARVMSTHATEESAIRKRNKMLKRQPGISHLVKIRCSDRPA